ncbi:uncharacterized protein LOC127253852 [Andrographis paniculata]|uniref:uncharacterized protein LOC127253852 n=1 Tax=Andrographis paniculata TaxID=175694 RepID=UPI0021E73F59|nr:uncharacterized protein LOC127253852 [Andrographis paniculata]
MSTTSSNTKKSLRGEISDLRYKNPICKCGKYAAISSSWPYERHRSFEEEDEEISKPESNVNEVLFTTVRSEIEIIAKAIESNTKRVERIINMIKYLWVINVIVVAIVAMAK